MPFENDGLREEGDGGRSDGGMIGCGDGLRWGLRG